METNGTAGKRPDRRSGGLKGSTGGSPPPASAIMPASGTNADDLGRRAYTIGLVAGVQQPIVVCPAAQRPADGMSWDPGAHFGIFKPDGFWFDREPAAAADAARALMAHPTNCCRIGANFGQYMSRLICGSSLPFSRLAGLVPVSTNPRQAGMTKL
jgi:hypothetical protein